MRGSIAWFAANPVAANLLMLLVVAGGLVSLPAIRMEIFPEVPSQRVQVSVAYPGAAPTEVEEAICLRVEEAIHGLEGVKRITSTAVEGQGTVVVELMQDANLREVLEDIKARVDAIATFPQEAERPVVQEVIARHEVIYVAVSGGADELAVRRAGERARDEIAALPGVSQVELVSVRPYEVSVEVSEEALRGHGLTLDDVTQAVRRGSLDMPAGSVRTPGGEVLFRAKGQGYRGEDFEGLVLRSASDGTRVTLGEVARVVDGFAETDQSARFDGERCVLIQVFRVGEQDALAVARSVRDYCREAEPRMPPGIRLTPWQDFSLYLASRLELLLRNGASGLVAVFAVLALFMRLRLAFWVTLGIPVAFLGTLGLMPVLGVSINMISLFAFILVLGIVVDDAIVVGESVYTWEGRGLPPLEAATRGTQRVAVPVVFSVLTTVAAFVPMLDVPGAMGRIFRVIPLIVIPILLTSLLESQFVLPAHLAAHRPRRRPRGLAGRVSRLQDRVALGLERFAEAVYRPSLGRVLERRYLVLAAGLATLLLTAGWVGGGRLRFEFLPKIEADYVVASLTMPQGTAVEETAAAVTRIEQAALGLRRALDEEAGEGRPGPVLHVLASVGEQPYMALQGARAGGVRARLAGPHLGEVLLELVSSEGRAITSPEVARRWREAVGGVPGAVELGFSSSLISSGRAVDVQLAGNDPGALRLAAGGLKAALASYPGVQDIADSERPGKQELVLTLRPGAEALGFRLWDLARQVRAGFYGEEAQRVQRGRDDVRVMVRYPAAERRSVGDLEAMRVRTGTGLEVPFGEVASVEAARGYSAIRRADLRRTVNVTADVDSTVVTADEVLDHLKAEVLPNLVSAHPGLGWTLEGRRREQVESLEGLARGMVLALIAIYALMAIPFRSYLQPAIVMGSIPMGLVGAVLGHLLMGMDLSIMSVFGMVAMAGVVVNDAIVLVDFINEGTAAGVPHLESVRGAGAARFRPILLTSVTTFAGLAPLLLERSVQAQFLVPMAVSLAFGVVFSTAVTLYLVPASFVILEDLRGLASRRPGT
ncbi:MAG: efflux RND transporter permease subunit [Planctomycetes bacterium]|nr:efflux RND transporter permease subunit [Planctomycetota bacterium]